MFKGLWVALGRVLSVGLIVTLFVAQAFFFSRYTVDDAFISYHYAENWVRGLGLVFNPGERVEGYSNFLWVALLALARYLGLDTGLAAKLFGLISALGVLTLLFLFARRLLGGRFSYSVGLLAVLVANFSFMYFAVTGMETAFFTFLITLAAYLLVRAEGRITAGAALALAAAALTRPEGALYFVMALAVDVACARRLDRRHLTAVTIFSAVFVTFVVWRMRYYGALLPNTFYAKPSEAVSIHGASLFVVLSVVVLRALPEFMRFFNATGGVVLLVAVVFVALSRKQRRPLSGLWLMTAAGFVFQLYAGDDWMGRYRFLIPVLPLYYVMIFLGLRRALEYVQKADALWKTWEPRLVGAFAVLLVLSGVLQMLQFMQERDHYPNFVLTSVDIVPAAQWVGQHYPPEYQIVCWRIGALAYYSRLRVIDDAWGLTDTHIARLRSAGQLTDQARDQYLAQRNPELLMRIGEKGSVPPPEVSAGGRVYIVVRRFRQGSEQWWDLYQRRNLASVPAR